MHFKDVTRGVRNFPHFIHCLPISNLTQTIPCYWKLIKIRASEKQAATNEILQGDERVA